MHPKLLVAVDGGELTERIVAYAVRIGKHATLHFVYAVDPAQFFSDAVSVVFDDRERRESTIEGARKVVDASVATAVALGIVATGEVVEAAPVEAILNTAERIGADLIVMASHGRSGFARAVLGSVAEGVARQARTGVLFVPSELAADDPSRHLHQIFEGV